MLGDHYVIVYVICDADIRFGASRFRLCIGNEAGESDKAVY